MSDYLTLTAITGASLQYLRFLRGEGGQGERMQAPRKLLLKQTVHFPVSLHLVEVLKLVRYHLHGKV